VVLVEAHRGRRGCCAVRRRDDSAFRREEGARRSWRSAGKELGRIVVVVRVEVVMLVWRACRWLEILDGCLELLLRRNGGVSASRATLLNRSGFYLVR
jgi:hypothetical protein